MAAEVGASAAAQQQIALPPEGADITNIQDEDLLRRMWQATEDFGRKKEIRARMYKLREQRLKEFYTTGEVLSDLMSTTLDSSTGGAAGSANNAGVSSTVVTTRRTTYAASESGDSVGGGGLVVTTTETIRGGGGSQESLVIRYRSSGNEEENLKNIEMDRRQVQGSTELIYETGGKTTRSTRSAMSSSNNQSSSMITKSANYGIHSQSLADQGFLTMKSKEIRDSESPTRDFSHLHNRQIQQTDSTTRGGPVGGGGYWYEESRTYHTGDDGVDVVQHGTRGGQQGFSSSSVIEYGDGGTTTHRTGEAVVSSDHREQTSSSTKKEESSMHQEHSASSSYSFSSSNKSTSDWVQRHQDDESFVSPQTQPLQIESVRGGGVGYEETVREERIVREKESAEDAASIHREQVVKTERVTEKAENDIRIAKEEIECRRTTEKVEEVETKEEPRGPKQRITQRSKTGELPLEVSITKQVTTEVITSVPSTATSTPLPDAGPTPDVGSWTVVSGKQNGVCSSTDEFVFRSGTTTTSNTVQDTTQKIISSETTARETTTREDTSTTEALRASPALTPTSGKPTPSMPAAGKPTPVDSPASSPSVEVKSIMKQTTTTSTTSTQPAPAPSGYYIQTKRISTEVSPTHDAFARSLRASPEKTQTYTRASSKTSIDTNTTILSSPTRNQRTSVTSPTGPSSSPDRCSNRPRDRTSPMKQQTPSPSASKEKRKLSSSLSKGVGGKRTATPGTSPTASPVRGRSPCADDDELRKPIGTSPEKKRSSVVREGSPFSEQPSRKSPGKETKPSTRRTPEKSPAREIPKDLDSPQDSTKSPRKPSDATPTKETKTTPTTPTGRRPSKGPKDEKSVGRRLSSDRMSSPASSPMKEKGPEFPKERKPSEDKTSPTSPQRPKDLDLKTRPMSGTKQTTPSSPLDKTPTKPKEQDKAPEGENRTPSKDTIDTNKDSPLDKEKPKSQPISRADLPDDGFEVVCEAPETFDVKIVTPIEPSVEYPTDEPGKKYPTKKTTEADLVTVTKETDSEKKKIVQELEIERIKKPSTIPGREPSEVKDSPYKPKDKSPVRDSPKRTPSFKSSPEKDIEAPRMPKDVEEKEPLKGKRPKSPETIRPTRKDSQPKKSPAKESPMREPTKEYSPSRKSPTRESPARDIQRKQSPSPSRDVPPTHSPSRRSPARDLPVRDGTRKVSPSSAREAPKSYSPSRRSPTRDSPSRRSPIRDSPGRDSTRKESPSPVREGPKSHSPSRRSPTRGSPVRDYQRKRSPSPSKDALTSRFLSRKSPTRDSPQKMEKSPSPAKDAPKSHSPTRRTPSKDSPRKKSPSPSRNSQRKKSPSPARDAPSSYSPSRKSPVRESPKKHSPSPAREVPKSYSPSRHPPAPGSPSRDSPRKHSPSPAKDSPKTYSPTRKSPARDTPIRESPRKYSPSPAKDTPKARSPTRKPSVKESPIRESPRKHSPSPTKDSSTRKSPARDSPLRDSPRKKSLSPAREFPCREPAGKSPARKSPPGDAPKKPSPERESPSKRRPNDKPHTDKSPGRKPSIKDSPRKESLARKTPERDTARKSPARQSPVKDTPKKTPTRPSPTKDIPKDTPARKPFDADVTKKPTLTRKSSEKERLTPKKDTSARRSQSTEIPATKRVSPFKDSPKTDDVPHRKGPTTESPTRKSPSRETPTRRIPQFTSPARLPADSPTAESPISEKPVCQPSYKSPTKDTAPSESPVKTPIRDFPPSGIPRTMSPARRPQTTDSLPSSPESPRQKDGKFHPTTPAPEKTSIIQRPSRSPERAAPRKHPDEVGHKTGTKPLSRIPGRTPSSSVISPSPKRQTPASSIPSYTSPLRRGPKDESSPSPTVGSPKTEPKGMPDRHQPGSRIPESHVRRPGESPVGRKPSQTTPTTRKPKKPKTKRPFCGTVTSEDDDISTSETEEDEETEFVEERVTVTEKQTRRVSEVFVQDMSSPQYPVQNGSIPDRPVSLSLITTATKTVTSGGEVQQTTDSEGNVTTRTYHQPSTVTMSVSCKNTDGQEDVVTRTVKKTYPDRPDEDEDVEIVEIDEDDVTKPHAIEYPSDEEPIKRLVKPGAPKQTPVTGVQKRFGSPSKPTKDIKPHPAPTTGKRPASESPGPRQPINGEPGKRRIPGTISSPSPKQPTTTRKVIQSPKLGMTTPAIHTPEDKSSPKSPRKPGQISRLPAKQIPKTETKRMTTTTGKTVVQQQKTTVVSSVTSTSRQQTNYVTSTVHKTQPRQPIKGAPLQPKQIKPAPKGRIPQKTGKGIPMKDTKKRVTNGRVLYSDEPEDEDYTEEEDFDDRESPIPSDFEKTEKYYTDEEALLEGKVPQTVTETKVIPKLTDDKPCGLHPSSAVSTPAGIPTSTEIRPVSRESTPDAPGRRQHPRYADRVSEPDDDELYYEEKGTTKITRRDQETIDKKTIDQIDRTITVTMPRLETVEQRYEEEDEEELREYERIDVERRRQVRTEQVTDLDEDEPKTGEDDEIEPATLSVASKVSRFLTASATAAAPPQPSQAPKITEPKRPRRPSWEPEEILRLPKGDEVDQKTYKTEDVASFAVKRARDIFETIAKTPSAPETTHTPTTPKIKTDVLGKASLFETRQVDEVHRQRTTQKVRQSFTGSEESLGEEGLPKEKPCTDFTESEEEYDDEPIVQVKETTTKRPLKETSPAPLVEKERSKESSPSRTFKPQMERESPKDRRPSRPSTEKPDSYSPKQKPINHYRDELYDEPSEDDIPEDERPKKPSPYEEAPKPHDTTTPKQTDTDATRRRNIFRDGVSPTEDDQSPKVKKTSVGSTMGREAFLKRMSKFASTEEDKTKTVQTVRTSPKAKPLSKFPPGAPSERVPKSNAGEPTAKSPKDRQSPSRKLPTDSATRRISREEPDISRRSPAREVPRGSTDTYTRRPSKDHPRSDLESPRRTPTREIPTQQSESPRHTDTYTRRPSRDHPRSDVESPRRTPTRDTPTQQTESPRIPLDDRRPSTDTYTRKPYRDHPRGDVESPRRTPTRDTPTQQKDSPRRPLDDRRPSTDTYTRRPSRDHPRGDVESPRRTPTRDTPTQQKDSPRRPLDDRRPSTDTYTRRPSRDHPRSDVESPRRTPTRETPTQQTESPRRPFDDRRPGTDTYTRRPSRDHPRSDVESPRRTPTRDTPTQQTESPRIPLDDRRPSTDTYTRKPYRDHPRGDVESPRRTPTRDTPTQQKDSPRRPLDDRRPSTDILSRKPSRDHPRGDSESPRRTPTRDTPSQPRKPQDERRPSTDTSTRRPSRDYPKEDSTPKVFDERPKGSTFTRRPSKDRVREDDSPKRPQDGTFTRRPKKFEDDSPRVEPEGVPRGSDTFPRRPSKDRQSPRRESPMRGPEDDSPRTTGTYTRKTSTDRFKESSPSPRSSPAREIQPKRPDESPRRPSQDRPAEDKPRGSDTFTRKRSQPRDEEPKKPRSAADALKPYLRTRTQDYPSDDDNKLKPDDKSPKKLSSSRFETFTKRDASTTVKKDDTKRIFPTSVDRTPKKLSGSRFDTFTKKDNSTTVKATEGVVSRTKTTTTRKSVEREVIETTNYEEKRTEYEEPIPSRKTPRESPSRTPDRSTRAPDRFDRTPERTDRRTPERAEGRIPDTAEKRVPDRTDSRTPDRRTPDRRTPDRRTPDRREESPATYGEPARKKPTKEVEDEPVRKAPRPEDEEVEPRISTRRRPSKEGSPHPETRPEDELPDQQRRRSSGGKFGVVLRQTSSVGSRVEALMSKVEKRSGTTTTTTTATVVLTPTKRRPSKGPEPGVEIEEIFDLEFLEHMLEKATDYDQRRRIRAQIRIVRRGEGRPEPSKEPTRDVPKERDAAHSRPTTLGTKSRPAAPAEAPEEPDVEDGRRGKPRRPSQTRESPEKVTPVSAFSRKPSRAEEVGSELTSPSVVAKLLPSPSTTAGTPSSPASRPSPSPSTSVPKKNSLTSSSGLPREACPTDSITSSYGVGPTDDSGRPLFGLRALRRPQQQAPDNIPSAPAPSPNTQSREASLEPRPQSPETSDIRDSSGRPLFGLRAITISSTSKTIKEGRKVIERPKSPETGERPESQSPSEDEEDVESRKEMPSTSTASTTETSVHLRDLVRRHEQHARGNVPSQPVVPMQKPRAKLRDSFILTQHSLEDEEEDVVEGGRSPARPVGSEPQTKGTSPASKTFPSALPSTLTESGKVISERSCTLKSIIQKHEKISDTEQTNDKLNRRDSGLGAYTEEEDLVPAKNNYRNRSQDYSTDEEDEEDYDDEEFQEIQNGQRPETTTVKVTSDVVRRPGILKKPKDSEVTESTATSTTSTIRSQQQTVSGKSSGYVSLKKDVIQSVDDSEDAVEDDEEEVVVVSGGKGRTPKGAPGRRSSNDVGEEAPSSRATYSSYTTSSSSSSVARSGGEVERRRSSQSTPYRVDEDDGDSNDGIEIIRTPSESRYAATTTTTVTRRLVGGSESPKMVTTTTTVTKASGRPEEEQTEVVVQDARTSSTKKKFEPTSTSPATPSPSTGFSRVARGGSVRALSQKFQQAAADAASSGPDSPSRAYPKAGLIFRTASFRQGFPPSPPASPRSPLHSPSSPCIPLTAAVNGHTGSKTTVGEVVERRSVTSSTARSQKDDTSNDYLQQIRRRSVENDRGSSPSSTRQSTEVSTVSSSRTRQPIVDEYDDGDMEAAGEMVTVEQRTVMVTNGSTGSQGRSFLGNQNKVTGVQDVLSRMREADNEGPAEGDTVEDSEARALLNKFLGAQVILQGMEPLINAQSPSLVRQVEKQRVQKKQESSSVSVVYSPDLDLDGIWDERRLRQLLDSCTDYDGRRKIRARIRTVMAEQKVTAAVVAEGRLEAERESQESSGKSKAIVSKQSDDTEMETSTTVLKSVQGELLPLIVDQLKTSLERGEGSGGGANSGFRISSSSSEEGPFDSGTESGEDRRHLRRRRLLLQQQMREEATGGEEGDAEDEGEEDEDDAPIPHGEFCSFMEGLKTSIEEAAARRRRERPPGDGEDSEAIQKQAEMDKFSAKNDKNGADELGEELLGEVHTALDKLQGTLENSTGLDPEKSQALIALISRLQTSLEQEQESRKENPPEVVPPPAAPPPRVPAPDWKARCQRKRQVRAHTVGVSQEELEDARRLLQQSKQMDKGEEKKEEKEREKERVKESRTAEAPAATGENRSYSLIKQYSAGDLGPPSWASNSVAARVFRPVHFEPQKSTSWASMFNKTAKPFQREALGKTPPQAAAPKYPFRPPPLPPPPAQPQLTSPSATSRTQNIQKETNPFRSKATIKPADRSQSENLPRTPQAPVPFEPAPTVSYVSQSLYVPPAAGVSVPPSPTTSSQPIWQAPYSPNPPTLSSSQTSSATNGLSHRDSESSITGSVSTKPETEEEEEDEEEDDEEDGGEGRAQTGESESGKEAKVNGDGGREGENEEEDDDENESEEVTQVTLKEAEAYTNGVASCGVRTIEPLLATAYEFRPPEKRSVHHSLSLDSGTKRSQEGTLTTPGEVGTRASPLARSWTLDDPSALLFTQAESVQIAVHKAAIKKQLSHEGEQRMRLPLRPLNGIGGDLTSGGNCVDMVEETSANPQMVVVANGIIEHQPIVAREVSGSRSDSYVDSANEGKMNGDDRYVHRTTSGSSVSSAASSKNSSGVAVSNGINSFNNANESQNPPVPPRRESVPTGNAYENNVRQAGGGNRDYESQSNRTWNQGQKQSVSNTQGTVQAPTQNYVSNENGVVVRGDLAKENSSFNRDKQSAEGEFAQLDSHLSNNSRQQNKMDKKRKMKRANTIDIPKPLNFYVDEEDYYSGDENEEDDGQGKEEGSTGLGTHRAAYLALRGPIRVKLPQNKPSAPSFQAKTENDRKFLAFLEQHSGNTVSRAEVQPTYHSSARGGAHWSNRFSHIKTAFEGTGRGSEHRGPYGRGRGRGSLGSEIGGPASARDFWRAADDSVTRSRGSSHGPRLSREGSTLLRRLFEERDAAAAENRSLEKADGRRRSSEQTTKLPWAGEPLLKGEDSVVIGSLTVASKKQLFSAMKAAPPAPEVKAPVPVGKFSHAPLSAFRPIQSKEQSSVPSHGSVPLSSPGAVRLATQKFGAASASMTPPVTPARPQSGHAPLGTKSPLGQRIAFVPKKESNSPVGGPLPWAKEDTHERVLSSTTRFETLSKEPSPPTTPSFSSHSVAHSHVYNLPLLGQPLAMVPQPTKNMAQSHHVDHSQDTKIIQQKKFRPQTAVPTPPPRSAVPRAPFVQQQQPKPLPRPPSPPPPTLPPPPIYAQPQHVLAHPSPPMVPTTVYRQPSPPPVVTQAIYRQPSSLPVVPSLPLTVYRQPSPPPVVPSLPKKVYRQPSPPPVVPPLPKTHIEPPSPEPQLQSAAVTKVMTAPVFQQAVVQKRRRGGDDDEEEEEDGRESAVRNLSTALHRLSVSPSRPARTTPPSPPKEQSIDSGRVFNAETYLHPNRASFIVEEQPMFKREDPSSRVLSQSEAIAQQNLDRQMQERNIPEKLSLKEQEEFYRKQLLAVKEAQEAQRKYQEAQNEYYQRASPHQYGPTQVTPHPAPHKVQHASITTDTRELNDESVVTMRLQIPVKEPDHYTSQRNAYSVSPIQKGIGAIRSNSHHDVRRSMISASPPQQRVESPRRDTEDRSPTSVLQKSESWHMLGQLGGSSQNSKRPQSLALELSKRRVPSSLPKMSFPKQFEARLSPETVETKQKRVEAYLKGQASVLKPSGSTPPPSKHKAKAAEPITPLLLDDNLENVDEAFESLFNAATMAPDKRVTGEKSQVTGKSQLSSQKGLQKSQSQHLLMAPAPPRESSSSPQFQRKQKAWEESSMVKTKLAQNISGSHSEATSVSSSTESSVTKTEVHTKTSNYSATVSGKSRVSKAPPSKVMSPFAKFKQLDEQNAGSAPNSPKSPEGTGPLFKFTNPQLCRSASGVKDGLLYWCQIKTKEYKNIQIGNFSTSWSNGLAFCALIHHFCPEAFDYNTLRPEERRKNFELAFRVADEKAGIAPLLDVEDMVMMRKPDWKCVFTYVQSIYRRFKDED